MNTNWIALLLIISLSIYAEAQKDKATDESLPLDEADDSQSKMSEGPFEKNESTSKESQSSEATKSEKDKSQIIDELNEKSDSELIKNREINKSEGSPEKTGKTKLPMNCISDYNKFCSDKFSGYQFNDGCHKCNCTTTNKDYCEKGDCRYYVNSFDEAADYCTKIEKEVIGNICA